MDSRRHQTETAASAPTKFDPSTAKVFADGKELVPASDVTFDSEAPAPAKPVNAMAEAVKLGSALAKIDRREVDALANAKARYQAERDAVLSVASEKAKRILEEAGRE